METSRVAVVHFYCLKQVWQIASLSYHLKKYWATIWRNTAANKFYGIGGFKANTRLIMMTMMIKIKSGRCRGRFEAKSKAEALVEALMGIGLLSQMPLCTTVFSAGLPCYIAQKNIAIAIAVFFCVVLHQNCGVVFLVYWTVLHCITRHLKCHSSINTQQHQRTHSLCINCLSLSTALCFSLLQCRNASPLVGYGLNYPKVAGHNYSTRQIKG